MSSHHRLEAAQRSVGEPERRYSSGRRAWRAQSPPGTCVWLASALTEGRTGALSEGTALRPLRWEAVNRPGFVNREGNRHVPGGLSLSKPHALALGYDPIDSKLGIPSPYLMNSVC